MGTLLLVNILLVGILSPIFLIATSRTVRADPSSWSDSNFFDIPIDEAKSRFFAISPFEIQDKVTKTIYKTAANDSELFGSGTADTFRNGHYWYWPNGEVLKRKDNKCADPLVVETSDGNGTLSLIAVKAKTDPIDTAKCFISGKSDVIGKGNDPPNNDDVVLSTSADVFHFFATTFYWESASQIGIYDTGNKLKPVTTGLQTEVENAHRSKPVDNFNVAEWDIFYNDACVNGDRRLDAWVAVNKGDRARSKIFHSTNLDVVAAKWQGNELECIFGRDINSSPRNEIRGDPGAAELPIVYKEKSSSTTTPTAPATGTSGDPSASPEAAGSIVKSCESVLYDQLAWLGCQILNSANKAIRRIDVAISQQLAFKQDEDVKAFDLNTTSLTDFNKDTDPGKAYYGIWSIFRFLASALIILAAIAMVIGQSLSFGPFDAYTVKKLLPKILAAVVFVNLSWELCVLAIQLVNGLGYGIRALMYAPFEANGTPIDQFFNVSEFESLAAGGGVIVGGFAIASSFGIMGILSLAITALLALAVGFAIIILRKVLITLLVVMAPIAIASMILPNTDKLWKFWKDSFTKGLMMFPIIMALLASGRIFSYMTAIGETGSIGDRPSVDQGSSTIANANDAFQGAIGSGQGLMIQVVAVLAYFAPYFLIPATFKFAGGALTTLTGQLNNRSKGLFDRNKNWRTNTKKARKENAAYNNYANRDGGGLRGRKARIALGSQAIGAGHSPLQRGDWNRTKAAQAGQAEKVLTQQFEDYGRQLSNPNLTPAQLRVAARSRNQQESAAAIRELLNRGEHAAVRELQETFNGTDQGRAQWETQKRHIRSELRDAGPDIGMRLNGTDIDDQRRTAFATASEDALAGMHHSAWQQYHGLEPDDASGDARRLYANPGTRAKLNARVRRDLEGEWNEATKNWTNPGAPPDINPAGWL